jgi:hypothetical protein
MGRVLAGCLLFWVAFALAVKYEGVLRALIGVAVLIVFAALLLLAALELWEERWAAPRRRRRGEERIAGPEGRRRLGLAPASSGRRHRVGGRFGPAFGPLSESRPRRSRSVRHR